MALDSGQRQLILRIAAIVAAAGPVLAGGHLALAVEVIGRESVGLEHLFGCAREEYLAAQTSGLGSDVHNPVGAAHHLLVVLHYDYRILTFAMLRTICFAVAQVPQFFERVDQTLVVALVQTYARLVQNIKHVHQSAAYLCGQTDTLRLTAGQRIARAVQVQVLQPHRLHESEAFVYLFEDLLGYALLARVQLYVLQIRAQFRQVHAGQLGDVLVANAEHQRLATEPLSMTLGTFLHVGGFFRIFVLSGFVRVAYLAFQPGNHALLVRQVLVGTFVRGHDTQSPAAGAPTLRGVEGERVRRGFGVGDAGGGTHQRAREIMQRVVAFACDHT